MTDAETATTTAPAETADAAPATPGAVPPPTTTKPGRRSRRGGRLQAVLLAFPVPIVFVLVWQLGVVYEWVLPFGIQMGFLPYPLEVAQTLLGYAIPAFGDDAFAGKLWPDLGASVLRVLSGFLLASVLGIVLGVIMGRSYVVNSLFDPFINLFRPIPATAWVPLVALIIGVGDQSTIFLITLSAFFPIVLGAASGARQVPPRLLEASRMLGAGRLQQLAGVVVPAAAPAIVNGLRVGLGLAWVVLVLGETVGVDTGLGATITMARNIVRTDLIVAGMICIGLAGFLSDRLLSLVFRLAFRGRPLVK
ncbi:ABC transporter permease [Agromyces seonyuensis]|uniref:ABC transporter permease subunit n=1 Tax=Agromyces seonyuensis TaxID=2662446 RepID=A0A6I4NWY2_9MICO|nr:ABC transporter permease [Agromyces seonyuensis]MWB98793.1 ABC transporter permease subunit [Agromyces seonyuensis]